MNAPVNTRRDLLLAGGFTLAFTLVRGGRAEAMVSPTSQAGDPAAAKADGNPAFAPNAFIRIDRTGPVRLVMPNVEMGQGIYTGEATLLAEELDVGLDQVKLEHSPPNGALYAMPLLGEQATGGSTSTRAAWKVLQQAGAVGRAMLVGAAAKRWGVDPAGCTVDRGVVTHTGSGRKATYGELAAEAARQPVPTDIKLKDPKDFKLIGKPFRRLDTAGKVDGSTVYGIDVRVPGMKIAAVEICPVWGGKLRSVDDSAARAIPGVRDVIRMDDAVAVTGDHFWAAKKGVEALVIDWDLGPHADFSTDGLAKDLEQSSRTGAAIVAREVGDQNHAGHTIEATYQVPMLAHAPMEPLNAVVHVRPDACEIWVGTQVPVRCVAAAAKVTGLPPEKIIVHNQYLGGGFGRRLEEDSVHRAVQIAKQVAYPVKMVWTREQDIRHDIPRPIYLDRISAVVDGDGYPVAWRDRVTSPSVMRRWVPVALRKDGLDGDTVEGSAEPPYDLPNLRVEWVRHDMPNDMPVGWWRGVGPTHNLFKVEGFIDELAHAANKDPVAYRRALLKKNPRALGVLNLAADKMGWGGPQSGPRIGRGCAVAFCFGSYVCAMTEVEVSPTGEIRLRRSVTAVDSGMVINPNTIEAQVQGGLVFGWTAALYSELTYKDGAAQQGNFNDYRMMRMNEVPPLEVHLVKSAEAPGGIGEVGTAIAAPALANAIFAATGVRLRRLPIDRSLLAQKQAQNSIPSVMPLAALALAAAGALGSGQREDALAEGDA